MHHGRLAGIHHLSATCITGAAAAAWTRSLIAAPPGWGDVQRVSHVIDTLACLHGSPDSFMSVTVIYKSYRRGGET